MNNPFETDESGEFLDQSAVYKALGSPFGDSTFSFDKSKFGMLIPTGIVDGKPTFKQVWFEPKKEDDNEKEPT